MNDPPRPPAAAASTTRGKSFLRGLVFWLSTVCLIAVLAVVVAELLRPATYTSEAWLMIRRQRVWLLQAPDERDGDEESFIENQFAILRSSSLLEPLASNRQVAETPELAGEKDVAAAIGRRLKITQRGKSDIYSISFTSVSPEHAHAVVQGVVNAYVSYHTTAEAMRSQRRIEALKRQGDARFREMAQLREQVKTKAILLTGVDPFQPERDEPLDADREFLKELQKELVRRLVQQELLAATIAAGSHQEPGSRSAGHAASSDKLQAAQSEYASGHATVKALQEKIAALRASQKHYTGDSLDLEFLRSKLAQVTEIHDAIHQHILALTTEQGGEPRVEVYAEASHPSAPDRRWWQLY
jgi:uncharacterized protein involved in exopolysaccharide biosynthesis